MSTSQKIELAILIVQTLTLLVLLWYAINTHKLRGATEIQARQITLPILEIEEQAMAYHWSNIGAGLAVAIRIPSVHLRDREGSQLKCEFEPAYMLTPGKRAELEIYIEARPAGRNVARDLSQARFREIVVAILDTRREFALPVSITDVAGRQYSARLTWSYSRAEWGEVGARYETPTPKVGPPELVSSRLGEQHRPVSLELRSLSDFIQGLPE